MGVVHRSVPISSTLILKREERLKYFEHLEHLPSSIRSLVVSPLTGAYLRGLVKRYNIEVVKAPSLSLDVLRIAVGELLLPQLPATLVSKFAMNKDEARSMAAEIEKDLFAPVALDLNKYLEQKKREAKAPNQGPTSTPKVPRNPRNILNLKDKGAAK